MGNDLEKALEMLMTMLGNKEEEESYEEPEEELNEVSAEEETVEDNSDMGLENMLGAFSGGNDKRVTLLSSIKPYMSGKRQDKIDTAINMVRILSISSGLGINLFGR